MTKPRPARTVNGCAAAALLKGRSEQGLITNGMHSGKELGKTTLAAMLSKFPITFGPQSDLADDHDLRVYRYGIFQA